MDKSYFLQMLLYIPGIIIGLSLHEFAHALAADKLGDSTPRLQGRLTIEPWPHIDLFGFLALLILHFGWGKPVQIDSRNFKNPRRDGIIVSLAGPLMNLIVACIFAAIILGVSNITQLQDIKQMGFLYAIFYMAILMNVVMFVFNLIPIPPLDGSHIIANLIPKRFWSKYYILQDFSRWIYIALIVLVFTGAIGYIMNPPIQIVYSFILRIFHLPDFLQIS